MTDLVIRPLQTGEEELFVSLSEPALVGPARAGLDYGTATGRRQYRPEWTWVALRHDRIVARAAWSGGPADDEPYSLDWFDFGDDIEAGTALLHAAPYDKEYILRLPVGWRDEPRVRKAAELRIAAAQRAGMQIMVERFRYTWTPSCGLPERPGRLEFRPEPHDNVVLDVLRRVMEGTLDAHECRTAAEQGVDAAAREELQFVHWMPSPREWLRLAYTPDGDVAGITVPGHNHTAPVIGFIGVVPGQRGHGYGYDLLMEATRMLAGQGADRILADTDTTNTPMAAAFARGGYPITEERVFLRWPCTDGRDTSME
jgi:GNAT superfamily N-acetyltransferase